MSENKLSSAWLDTDEDIIEEEETVFSGSESPYIQGYGAYDTKITMAKLVTVPKKEVQFIEVDFVAQNGKTHSESFMIRGKDGKSFYVRNGKKFQHFGVNKIKSLIKVCGLYSDETNLMAALFSNTEQADVTEKKFGKEETNEFTIFTDLIGCKTKLCITSKDENTQKSKDYDNQPYIKACIKATEAYKKANPKKRSLNKFKASDEYVNVYQHFVNSSVSHFCTVDGLFASEMESGEGASLTKFLEANDEGLVFEGRTLIAEDLTEKERAKLSINEWGKEVVADDEDGYEEPTETEEEESEEW